MQPHPHVDSWYAASANRQLNYPSLKGELRTDVCIIGGGYTGLSAAIHLRKAGYSATLLEANQPGWGASGRNGGHVGTGQRSDQLSLEKMLGTERATSLWQLGLEAVDTVCDLIEEFAIDCDLRSGDLHTACSAKDAKHLRSYCEHLQEHYDYHSVRYVDAGELREMSSAQGLHGAMLDSGCRHLHPLNYALGLAAAADHLGAQLFEHSRALRYQDNVGKVVVETADGQVIADHLVIACNGYLDKFSPAIAGKIMPINNYMIATEPLSDALASQLIRDDVSMSDSLFVVNYWKLSADKRLLFGGGETYSRRFPADIKGFVRKCLLRRYPELASTKIDYGWGGTLAITLNRMPSFGRAAPTVLYAQGYSGHGVPTATLAGKLIAEAIAGNPARFDLMASVPTTNFPGGTLLRWPGLVAGMLFYSLRDKLG